MNELIIRVKDSSARVPAMNWIQIALLTVIATSASIVPDRSGPVVVSVNETEWQLFKTRYERTYRNSNEESLRQTIFATNQQRIQLFNRAEAETRGFTLAVNHMADWTDSERRVLSGFKLPSDWAEGTYANSPEAEKFLNDILADDSIEVPDELDWRDTPGRVSAVKSQGVCGSCWAFASTGALEGQEKTRKANSSGAFSLVGLSEQNLVDCDKLNFGCRGGIMSNAFKFIHQQGGIEDEQDYPYDGQQFPCNFDEKLVAMTDSGAAVLPRGDEEKLKQVVAKFGPVAVAIDALGDQFYWYHSGIYYGTDCGNTERRLNHGVLVVGYGSFPKLGDYWIVKNSFGGEWGNKGYIKMARNRGNNCGIATLATIPTF